MENPPDKEIFEGTPKALKVSLTALGSATQAPAFNVNGNAPTAKEAVVKRPPLLIKFLGIGV